MSTQKTLVLTRPDKSARCVVSQIKALYGGPLSCVMSPVMAIEPLGSWPDLSPFATLVVTSAHAVRGPLVGKPVYCVGERTAQAVIEAGGDLRLCAPDAATLLPLMKTAVPDAPVAYLRGAHVASDIAGELADLSVPCTGFQVYRQRAIPLTDDARRLLEGDKPAILPLYSPRSARLVGESISHAGAGLHVISISAAAANAWRSETGAGSEIAPAPTGAAMVSRIVAALTA